MTVCGNEGGEAYISEGVFGNIYSNAGGNDDGEVCDDEVGTRHGDEGGNGEPEVGFWDAGKFYSDEGGEGEHHACHFIGESEQLSQTDLTISPALLAALVWPSQHDVQRFVRYYTSARNDMESNNTGIDIGASSTGIGVVDIGLSNADIFGGTGSVDDIGGEDAGEGTDLGIGSENVEDGDGVEGDLRVARRRCLRVRSAHPGVQGVGIHDGCVVLRLRADVYFGALVLIKAWQRKATMTQAVWHSETGELEMMMGSCFAMARALSRSDSRAGGALGGCPIGARSAAPLVLRPPECAAGSKSCACRFVRLSGGKTHKHDLAPLG